MRDKRFEQLQMRFLLLSLFARAMPRWWRYRYLVYAVFGFSFLVSCTAPSDTKKITLEDEDFLVALTEVLKSDPFFEARTRCFFLSIEGIEKGYLHENEEIESQRFKSALVGWRLYKQDQLCMGFNWSDAKQKTFSNWIFPDGSARNFVDSPDFILGVSIFMNKKKAIPSQIYTSFEEFTKIRKKIDAYCVVNKCPEMEMLDITIWTIDFSMCNSPVFNIWSIGNKVLDVHNTAISSCVISN